MTRVRILATYDSKRVRFEMDYDDVTFRVSALRCVNGTAQDAYGELVRNVDQVRRGRVFAAGTTVELAIPQSPPAARFVVLIRDGHPSGMQLHSRWPA